MVTQDEVQQALEQSIEDAIIRKKTKKIVEEYEKKQANSNLYAFLEIDEVKL